MEKSVKTGFAQILVLALNAEKGPTALLDAAMPMIAIIPVVNKVKSVLVGVVSQIHV